MIKAIAIDDEPLALEVIKNFSGRYAGLSLLHTFTRPLEGLAYLSGGEANLVFLDIQMPSMTGTQLARQLRPGVMVIFTTAFENFAVEGFNLNAVDYLLKPFSYERFGQAMEKAKKAEAAEHSTDPFITVRADYSLMRVSLEKIHYIEGLDDYLKIHLTDAKTIVARLTMKGILDQLPAGQFIRIHRSFIVPHKKVSSLKRRSLFLGPLELPIGSSYEKSVQHVFEF